MAQQLDRTKPLWEIWMVEGLENGHWALLSKVHHCMVDGVSGAELLSVVLDISEEPPPDARPPAVDPRSRRRPPSGSPPRPWSTSCAAPTSRSAAIRASLRVPRRRGPRWSSRSAKGLASVATVAVPPPQSSLNGTDRPAPPLRLGRDVGRRHQDGPAWRSAARSTTSCWRPSPAASGDC